MYNTCMINIPIFQCYIEFRQYSDAVIWLEKGKQTPVVSQDVSKCCPVHV